MRSAAMAEAAGEKCVAVARGVSRSAFPQTNRERMATHILPAIKLASETMKLLVIQ